MPDKKIASPRLLGLITAAVLLLAAAGIQAAEFTREFSFSEEELTLVNLIGEVRVEPSANGDFRVKVRIAGEDAAEDLMQFVVEEGDDAELVIKFPVDKHRDFIYPALERGNECVINFQQDAEGSWLKKIFSELGSKKIKVRGSGRGLEMWADVTIQVPAGAELKVRHGVGDIKAARIEGDLNLDSHAGTIEAENITGDVLADTGSGAVFVSTVQGKVEVDTGSGSVQVSDCRGDKVYVDTGSGSVKAWDLACESLEIDTGSGGVNATGVASDKILIDTGSGSVHLQLDRLAEGRVEIDTGSGRVELILPADASATINADTGSGGIKSHLDGAVITESDDDELSLEIGGGDARVILDTGSGSITIKQQ